MYLRNLYLIISYLILLFISPACLDQIDLSIPSKLQDGLVIQAKVVKGEPHQVEVRISQLYNFDVNSLTFVDADQVLLVHENGNQIEIPKLFNIYRTSIPADEADFPIDYFTSCHLEVYLADGRIIRSHPESLLPIPPIDSINYDLQLDYQAERGKDEFSLDTFAHFYVNMPLTTELSQQASRLRFELARSFKFTERVWPPDSPEQRDTCFITSKVAVTKPLILDGVEYPQDYLQNQFIYSELTNSYYFTEGYYLHVYSESLTETAFQHFDQIFQSVNRTGDMFEAPAGPVYSNLFNLEDKTDPVYGYFYMTERDTFRQYVPPSFLNYPDTFCLLPLFTESTPYPEICENCLIEAGSTFDQPSWWKAP